MNETKEPMRMNEKTGDAEQFFDFIIRTLAKASSLTYEEITEAYENERENKNKH